MTWDWEQTGGARQKRSLFKFNLKFKATGDRTLPFNLKFETH
jgi:hypothetical protein